MAVMQTWLVVVASLGLLPLTAPSARASRAVERTLVGCVIESEFYSVDGRAYRIATSARVDLRALEGKGVSMHGWLRPGDYFELAADAQPVVIQATCPAASLRLIKNEQVIDLRVAAGTAAAAGDIVHAEALITQALALVSPPECDTFTDHADVMARKGDLAAVAQDLAIIGSKKCFVAGRMNPLLLQDLGNLLRTKGDKLGAVNALRLALAACDGAWCRPNIQRDLDAATK